MTEFKRHFDENFFKTYKNDLIKLIKTVNEFDRQVDFQIRTNNKFALYHLGQSIGCVECNTKKFKISTSSSFEPFSKLSETARKELGKEPNKPEFSFKNFNTYFTKSFIQKMCAKIKKRNHQAERQIEQKILADNMHNPEFFIIDSEVIVPNCNNRRLDLLGLKRANGNNYVLVLLELKLINNQEAKNGDVIEQINSYYKTFNENLSNIADSYEINYRQKKELGIYSEKFPDEIKISHKKVEKAIIISDGITKALQLKSDIKNNPFFFK